MATFETRLVTGDSLMSVQLAVEKEERDGWVRLSSMGVSQQAHTQVYSYTIGREVAEATDVFASIVGAIIFGGMMGGIAVLVLVELFIL